MSVAPRSSRLNSSILPRFRSQPIHACSPHVPLPVAVKQEEAIGVLGAELEVERLDARARAFENRRVSGRVGRARVGEVAEDREMDARIEIAERQHLDVLEQRVDARRGWSASSGR